MAPFLGTFPLLQWALRSPGLAVAVLFIVWGSDSVLDWDDGRCDRLASSPSLLDMTFPEAQRS